MRRISEQNVEVVLGVFEAFRRRESERTFAAYDPDIEWSLESYLPLPGAETVYRGHEGIRKFFRTWLEEFAEYDTEALDPLDWDDKVLVTVYDWGRGKGSGVRIERYHAQLWTLRDALVVRVELFEDRAQALEAVGLSEQDAHSAS